MEKICLSKKCKNILLELQHGKRRILYDKCDYYEIKYLISKDLIKGRTLKMYHSDLALTDKGKLYLYENPKLKNPSIWDDKKYWINTAISVFAIIVSLIALFKD